jgi:hypothetical protein
MRKIFLGILFCFFVIISHAQTADPNAKTIDKILAITNGDYDMGKIPSGKPLEYNVTIKNISKDTVILQEVRAGCGCTTPKYRANEVILPGKSTFITLGFNGGANGEFSKFADIYFNNGLTKQLKFYGNAFTDSTAAKIVPAAN